MERSGTQHDQGTWEKGRVVIWDDGKWFPWRHGAFGSALSAGGDLPLREEHCCY